ncbi:MAG TPA: CbiX/SirB N-terminal domain-containing protein [Verrucomicrobiales bacterium]|nr:CbiX/SirB N-terminal domain-containing protein [Verrucomicrobiales bacterium]
MSGLRQEQLFKPQAALVIIAHGSTLNPDSSEPAHRHGDCIRQMNLFGEVVCAFWKEQPGLRDVLFMLDSEEVYIVPLFISEGYFTREVIPRELGLTGSITRQSGKTLYYCDPVGIHPSMTGLLLHRAHEAAPAAPPEQTTLFIAGHGTGLNERSREAIEAQVRRIRELPAPRFAAVHDIYMEETPLVSDWPKLTDTEHAVVVPFFIADGLHSYQDIPVMLGLEKEPTSAASQRCVFRENPVRLHGRLLYYSAAVGADSLMPQVILDQVADFDARQLQSTPS